MAPTSKSEDIIIKRGSVSVKYPIISSLKVTTVNSSYSPDFVVGSNSFKIPELEDTYYKKANIQYKTRRSLFNVGVNKSYQETNGAVEFEMGGCGYQEFSFSIKLSEKEEDEDEDGDEGEVELVDKLVAVVDCYGQPASGASISISKQANGSFSGGGIIGSNGTVTFRGLIKGKNYPVKIVYRGVTREDSFTA